MWRVLIGALASLAVAPAAAQAQTTGPETFSGTTVRVGGASITSSLVAQGVFTGTGRIEETPGGEDLVFDAGTVHGVAGAEQRSFTFDPTTCVFNRVVRRVVTVDGGTGQFADATGSYRETISGWGTLSRAITGACAPEAPPLHEIDVSRATGTLSF
jgi:hypothetical protein